MKLLGHKVDKIDKFALMCGIVGCYLRYDEIVLLGNTLRTIDWIRIVNNIQISDTTIIVWTVCTCTGLILGNAKK